MFHKKTTPYVFLLLFCYVLLLFIIIAVQCYASVACAVMWCQCVCLQCSYILLKQINISSIFFHHRVAKPF